ncbi:MAG: RidA family protein [Myxococcota bacterium]
MEHDHPAHQSRRHAEEPRLLPGDHRARRARTLHIGGQNGVDEKGQLVSKNLGEQTARAVDNLIKVLEAAGGTLEDLVRVGIYVKGDADIRPGFEAWMQRWGPIRPPSPCCAWWVWGCRPTFSSRSRQPQPSSRTTFGIEVSSGSARAARLRR